MSHTETPLECPQCHSTHLRWAGIENEATGRFPANLAGKNPAVVIHKWQCFKCGHEFKQRLE
jgi:predicted Zn-ribbon and HTH transcriptional regulator